MYVVFDDHSKGAWIIENTRIIVILQGNAYMLFCMIIQRGSDYFSEKYFDYFVRKYLDFFYVHTWTIVILQGNICCFVQGVFLTGTPLKS